MNTPTEQQIKEAAATSADARKALQKLFPEVFEPKECRIDQETMDSLKDNNKYYEAAKQIAETVDYSFMRVMNCVYRDGVENRQGFLLASESQTQWKIEEIASAFGKIQVLTPKEIKKES